MSEVNFPIRVMLVDDHHLFRDGVASLLKRDDRFSVLSEASSGEQALELLGEPLPNVILMDVRMPGISGIEATRQILQKYPSVKVVMITASEKDEDLFDAIKAGAQGYVLKAVTDSKQMREAILAVAAGEAIIPPAMVPRLLNEFASIAKGEKEAKVDVADAPPATPVDVGLAAAPEETVAPEGDSINLLTPREREVLGLVAEGLTNKEIANRLTISVNTVRSHLRFILDKLHINNRVQAAIWFQSKQ